MNTELNLDKHNFPWMWAVAGVIMLFGVVGYLIYNSAQKHAFTSLSQISGKPANVLIGKEAELKNMTLKLAGANDFTFWISNKNGGQDLLVFLNFDLQSKTHLANESRLLKDGQRVNIKGSLKAVPQNIQVLWNLNQDDAKLAESKGLYLEAQNLEVLR